MNKLYSFETTIVLIINSVIIGELDNSKINKIVYSINNFN